MSAGDLPTACTQARKAADKAGEDRAAQGATAVGGGCGERRGRHGRGWCLIDAMVTVSDSPPQPAAAAFVNEPAGRRRTAKPE